MRRTKRKAAILTVLIGLSGMGYLTGCHKSVPQDNYVDSISPSEQAVSQDRKDVDELGCLEINLAHPATDSDVMSITNDEGELAIKIHSEKRLCLKLSGTYDGGVTIKNQKNADLDFILDNLKIISDKHNGYLDFKSNNGDMGNTYLVKLVGESSITGSSAKKSKDVISSKANLSFTGDGKLIVTGRYKNGITCDDVLTVYSGEIDITLDRKEAASVEGYHEKGFGIKTDNGFVMKGGKVTVHAVDNIDQYESRGIKVDGSDKSDYYTGKGYVRISGGELYIESDAKGLSAGWDVDEDAKTKSTEDDPLPDVEISGGRVEVLTKGVPRGSRCGGGPGGFGGPHGRPDGFGRPDRVDENGNPVMPDRQMIPPRPSQEQANGNQQGGDPFKNVTAFKKPKRKTVQNSDGTTSTTLSPEGIEAKRHLTISGGTVIVRSTDDGLNAGELLTISGGEVFVYSSGNDAMDSNAKMIISGGKTVAFGAAAPDGALDADRDENVVYTGGLLVALGGDNNSPQGEGSQKEKFVSIALAENEFGKMPPFGQFPGQQEGQALENNVLNDINNEKDQVAPGAMPPMDIGREKTKSELAGRVIAVAESGKTDILTAIKVPEEFTGGGSLLILSENIQKDLPFRFPY